MEITENAGIEQLFVAGAHIGYTKSRRHPKMSEFVFGTRNNVEVFDLVKTEAKLKEAEEFLRALGKAGGTVLWVGTKAPARAHVEAAGKKTKSPYVFERWLGGTLTNFKIFEGRLGHLVKLEAEEKAGEFEKYSKKEKMMKTIEIKKLARMFGGLRPLKSLLGALVIVDPGEEKTALAEAERKNIPVVALLNVDCDPRDVNYPIPLNDNSSAAIALVLDRLALAYEAGLREKEQTAQTTQL
ncbi:MAG: 30S ribosomal protein S2 [Candidatus Giovannonibacteria bacterium]|nr:MAG: 30S ribosomal protein S2 [Candidatus Giovannonibacteria bacterium]